MEKVDFVGNWNKAWAVLSNGTESIWTTVAIVGIVVLVFSIGKFIWDRKRGSGGNTAGLLGAAAVGALMCSPQVVIPILLMIFQIIVNMFINFLGMIG